MTSLKKTNLMKKYFTDVKEAEKKIFFQKSIYKQKCKM